MVSKFLCGTGWTRPIRGDPKSNVIRLVVGEVGCGECGGLC